MKLGNLIGAFALSFCAARANAQYTLTTLATFDGINGEHTQVGLIADSAGNLYGTSPDGGWTGYGTLFEVAATTHQLTALVTFGVNNGGYPTTGLVSDNEGNFYGTTAAGDYGGTIFRLSAVTHEFTTLAAFEFGDGRSPSSKVLIDQSGNLFGTTLQGGPNDVGTFFELAAGAHSITTLATFNGLNGTLPEGDLVRDKHGNFYGVTPYGGAFDLGTVYKVDAATHQISTVVTFENTNGANPFGGLVADARGNLYGTTDNGVNGGTIFKIAADTNTLTTLATYDGSFGFGTHGRLIVDDNGNLYGTAVQGGSGGFGTIFKFDASTNAVNEIGSFNQSNGAFPYSDLIVDANGSFYGTTTGNPGTPYNFGTVFELSPVPEPSSLVLELLAMGGLILIGHNRQRRRRIKLSTCYRVGGT